MRDLTMQELNDVNGGWIPVAVAIYKVASAVTKCATNHTCRTGVMIVGNKVANAISNRD